MQTNFDPSPSFKPPKTVSSIFINALYDFTRYLDEPDQWFDCSFDMQRWDIVGLLIEEMSKKGWNIRLQGPIKNLKGSYPWYVHFEKWTEEGFSEGFFEEHEDGPCAIVLAAIKTLSSIYAPPLHHRSSTTDTQEMLTDKG